MANPNTVSRRRSAQRAAARGGKSTLTMTLMTGRGVTQPKGTLRVTFKASPKAVKMMAGRPGRMKSLLQRYWEAFAKSSEEGRQVSFRVDVDPSGSTKVTPVEKALAENRTTAVAESEEPSSELENALAAARDRGRIRAAEILASEDMLSAEAFAELLGTTRMTVNTKRQNGQLLGLDGAKRGFRFPVWQLNREGKPYPELQVLQERLGGSWAVFRFLVQPHGELDGLTGREALEHGKSKAVLAAAESIGRGDFR